MTMWSCPKLDPERRSKSWPKKRSKCGQKKGSKTGPFWGPKVVHFWGPKVDQKEGQKVAKKGVKVGPKSGSGQVRQKWTFGGSAATVSREFWTQIWPVDEKSSKNFSKKCQKVVKKDVKNGQTCTDIHRHTCKRAQTCTPLEIWKILFWQGSAATVSRDFRGQFLGRKNEKK